MAVTNELGTADSQLANIQLGDTGSSPPPPPPPPAGDTLPIPPIRTGPPLAGAPWRNRPLAPRFPLPVIAPVVVALPSIPPVLTGPRLRGAPWSMQRVAGQTPAFTVSPESVSPAPIPPILTGPSLRGAPWSRFGPHGLGSVNAGAGQPESPQDEPGSTNAPSLDVPMIQRDPSQEPRLRRFTEVVSQILNSLMVEKDIIQTGIGKWRINYDNAGNNSGLTGSFSEGEF